MITGKNYIGNHKSSAGERKLKTFNPLSNTEKEVAFAEASTEEIDIALDLAWQAFEEFRNYSGSRKS